MGLRDKIAAARLLIERVVENFQRPAVMWSGGKDSMVLLHLVREAGVKCPVILHRHPKFPEKYEFQDRLAREWELEVYDWAPGAVRIWAAHAAGAPGEGRLGGSLALPARPTVTIVNEYVAGAERVVLPQDIYEPMSWEGNWACGLKDFLQRPVGSFAFPWDVVFHGHKSSDADALMGRVPLKVDIKLGQPACAFPLRTWTDEDVWDYTVAEGVPQQADRYGMAEAVGAHWNENPDRTSNSDYFAGCTRCLDRNGPDKVFCPRLQCEVDNVGARAPYMDVPKLAYLEKGK